MSTHGVSSEQKELLAMLAGELQALLESNQLGANSHSADQYLELAEQIETFANAAELIGLEGLCRAWKFLAKNILALKDFSIAKTEPQAIFLDKGISYFLDYLHQLSNDQLTPESVKALTQYLHQSHWPLVMDVEEQEALNNQLLRIQMVTEEGSALPELATSDMVSLKLPEDINADLFEGLMIEMPNQVAQFSEQLTHFAVSQDKSALGHAQRIAHTIKGAANVVGISGLANFMHYAEDLLEEVAKHQEAVTPALHQLFIDMADTLASMLDALMAGSLVTPAINQQDVLVMQEVLNAYHSIRRGDLKNYIGAKSLSAPNPEHTEGSIQAVNIVNASGSAQPEPAMHDAHTQHLRIKEDTAQDLLRLAGESAISTNRLQTQVHDVKSQLQHIGSLHNKLTQLTEEFGQLIEVKELFNSRTKNDKDENLDPLELDKYNELHSFFHQLQEFAIDTRDAILQTQQQLRELEEVTFEQQVVNRTSQNHLLQMRMIPANSLAARFQRCVRQAGRLTGKDVLFELVGGDTMIDSRVLHELVDPIMHLLRNAVDHGIESPEERVSSGKSAEGKIQLNFSVQQQSILIQVVDDGAGLHIDKIARKAEELGIRPPADLQDTFYDAWLKQLIFTAGFSTRNQVNHTSGRGIGLDMVAERAAALKGRVSVESIHQQGCEFLIRLPLPMITQQGLLVMSGDHHLVISARGVEQLLFLTAGDLKTKEGQLFFEFNGSEIEVFHIAQLAAMRDPLVVDVQNAHALIVVEGLLGQPVGILVEKVLSSREMVVKPLTPYTPVISGVVGATILGDGQVAPVIDLQQMVLDLSQMGANSAHWANLRQLKSADATKAERPMALIVDDSLSTRRSLAQFVGDLGLEVRTAKDGYEAIEILQERCPQLLLVDMEMPRMNGLELTAHVRANEATRNIPIIMITSRNTEKHRQLAEVAGVDTYLNKPYSEEELLHHIQVNIH